MGASPNLQVAAKSWILAGGTHHTGFSQSVTAAHLADFAAGHGEVDGVLQEWIAWPVQCLYPLPDLLSDEDGVMLKPLGVALQAVDLGILR